jgi:hypothetical protein
MLRRQFEKENQEHVNHLRTCASYMNDDSFLLEIDEMYTEWLEEYIYKNIIKKRR